jgi:MFS transporter, SP family, sugar:H+ symporter
LQVKGLSLEQIDILYQNTTPIKSVAYRNQLVANDVHAADHEGIARINSKLGREARGLKELSHSETSKEADIEKAEDVHHEEKVTPATKA